MFDLGSPSSPNIYPYLLSLKNIENACISGKNLLPTIIDAALEYATLGEIVNAMKKVFGDWVENSII